MSLDKYLEEYNREFWKSFKTLKLLDILLYDCLWILAVVLSAVIYVMNSKDIVLAVNYPLAIFLSIFLFVLWLILRLVMWSSLFGVQYSWHDFIVLAPLYLIYFLIVSLAAFAAYFILRALFIAVFTHISIYLASLITAIILIFLLFPAIAFALMYCNLFTVDQIRKTKTSLCSKKHYINAMYVGLAFAALAVFSVFLKLLPQNGEALASGIALLLYFAWEKSYFMAVLK